MMDALNAVESLIPDDCDFDGKPIMDKLRGDLFNGVQIDGFNLD